MSERHRRMDRYKQPEKQVTIKSEEAQEAQTQKTNWGKILYFAAIGVFYKFYYDQLGQTKWFKDIIYNHDVFLFLLLMFVPAVIFALIGFAFSRRKKKNEPVNRE